MTVGITELPPEGMQLGGVALAGDPQRGTKTTEGLSLLFTTAGITVQGPQPQIERLLVWSGLDSAACSEKTVLPDGRKAGVMELTSGGQTIRFLLPTETVTPGQAAYLDQALPAWLKRYKETGSSPLPPPPAQVIQPAPHVTPPLASSLPANGAAGVGHPGSPPTPIRPTESAPPAAASQAAAPPPPAGADRPLPPPPARTAPSSSTPQPPPPPPTAEPPHPATPPPPPGMPTFSPEPPTAALGEVDAPPPPLLPQPSYPLRTEPVGSVVEVGPAPSGTPWDYPPLGEPVEDVAPAKRRGWRKSRDAAPGPASELGESAIESRPQPPADPPVDPVRLAHSTLPAPTVDAPAIPKDPAARDEVRAGSATPEDTETDTAADPALDGQPAEVPPTKRGWRRGAKPAVALAAATAAESATPVGSSAAPGPAAGPILDPTRSPEVVGPQSNGSDSAPAPATSTGDTPASTEAATARPSGLGEPLQPAGDGETPGDGSPPDAPNLASPPRNNRSMVILLLVLLLVVIGGIAYFAVKKNNDTTTVNPLTPNPTVSPVSADSALAASINLRRSDLPTGWSPTPASAQVARPPVAPATAQVAAERNLASCIGGSYPGAAGIFGDSVLPGQTDSVRSPTFQNGSDTTFQMSSTTTVMSTAAEAQALTTSFANPNLATCLGQYQSTLAAAAMPGATAQVQMVTLPAPPGVSVLGYITTLALPNQGTEVIGQAFLVSGRVETRLEPTTSGEAVPGDVFTPAYNAVAARVAAAAKK